MQPVELVRGFLIDLWHIPFPVKIFLVFGGFGTVQQWVKRRRHDEMVVEAQHWPSYRARVVWAQVATKEEEKGKHGAMYWEGLLTYSYSVPGKDLEIGEYRRKFYVQEEADAWARALRDTSIEVRVDPVDVTRSWWPGDMMRVPMASASSKVTEESWGVREILAMPVFLACVAGAGYAAFLQWTFFRGHSARDASDHMWFWSMHLGAILAGVAAALLKKSRGVSFRSLADEEPSGSGRVWKVITGYTTVVFVYCWVRMAAHDDVRNFWSTLASSSMWMLFYAEAAAEAWTVMRGGASRSAQND